MVLKRCQQNTHAKQPVHKVLKSIYKTKLLPIEEAHHFHSFGDCKLEDGDLEARPLILVLGQVSVGKTSFIKHLLGQEHHSLKIASYPTTRDFIVYKYNETERDVSAFELAADKSLPFNSITSFGNSFVSRLRGVMLKSDVLQGMVLVDSPGVMSHHNVEDPQFQITEYVAQRADMILFLTDPGNMDISTEMQTLIKIVGSRNAKKIHVILNKSDTIPTHEMPQVITQVRQSLAPLFNSDEVVPNLYTGSFSDMRPQRELNRDERELYDEIERLANSVLRKKATDLALRIRKVKAQTLLLQKLRNKMPRFFGKAKKQQELIDELPTLYEHLGPQVNGNLPDVQHMQSMLLDHDFARFNAIRPKELSELETVLEHEIPSILNSLNSDNEYASSEGAEALARGLNAARMSPNLGTISK